MKKLTPFYVNRAAAEFLATQRRSRYARGITDRSELHDVAIATNISNVPVILSALTCFACRGAGSGYPDVPEIFRQYASKNPLLPFLRPRLQ